MRTDENLFLLLKSACRQVTEGATAEALDTIGVHGTQVLALLALADEGPLGVSALGRAIDVKRAAATSLVDRLEAEGYVARRESKEDARVATVHLTRKGTARAKKATKMIGGFDATLREGFSPRDVKVVLRFLESARDRFAEKR